MSGDTQFHGSGHPIELVTFHLDDLRFGIDIHQVQEIIRLRDLTVVPHTPHFVRGVTDLRGTVITIVDLRRILGVGTTPIAPNTPTVVVRFESEPIGLLVDRVGEVVFAGEESLEPIPGTMAGSIAQSVDRVHKIGDAILCILNLDTALAARDLEPTP